MLILILKIQEIFFLTNRSNSYFEGKIISIKNDEKNHNALTLYSSNDYTTLPSLWDYKV